MLASTTALIPLLAWSLASLGADHAPPDPTAKLPAAPTTAPANEPTPPAEDPFPAGEDVSPEELFGDPPPEKPPTDPPSGDPPKDPPATDQPPTPKAPSSIDDIFGTDADHTDVKVQSKDGPSEAGPSSKTAKLLDKLDFRFRLVTSAYYDIHKVEQRAFSRQENRLELGLTYTPNKHIQIVGDVQPVFFGLAQTPVLDDLASQRLLTPFHVESDSAYVALVDLLPGLDIKIGRQIVVWGTADKFNPTNNINPDDLEDRPLFTEPIANQMVVVDYAPLQDRLWFQGVYVPTFFPALLPPSAATALQDPQSPVPYAREADNAKIDRLQLLLDGQPYLVPSVIGNVRQPSRRFTTGQSAAKIGTTLGEVDLSLSYYNGRHDIPTPVDVRSSEKNPTVGDPTLAGCCYQSDVTLIYPRMQVVGFDFATELPFLGDMGLWGEGALFIPQKQELRIEFPIPIDVTSGPNDDGIQNTVRSMIGPTIRSTPYIKATAGIDYTFGKHVYVQAQYLRGFIDEFGADHIGNYLVAGSDLVFFGRHFIFRLFGVVDFPTGKGDRGSYVVFPEILLVPPWGSLTFEVGSFFLIGKGDTKFGQKATGSSIAFFKVVGAF